MNTWEDNNVRPLAPRSLMDDGKKELDRFIDAYDASYPTSDHAFRPGVLCQKLYELCPSEVGKEHTLRMLLQRLYELDDTLDHLNRPVIPSLNEILGSIVNSGQPDIGIMASRVVKTADDICKSLFVPSR